jgi:multicomponent Na+:H+ antiporter subunit C
MSQYPIYALAAVALICLGLHGLLVRRHLLRKILALNVTSSGIFLLLIAVARRNEDGIPDPVPHAMVLTGIVVAVAATALALGILRRMSGEADGAQVAEDELE